MKLSPALEILNVDKRSNEQVMINGKPIYALPGGLFCTSQNMYYAGRDATTEKDSPQVTSRKSASTEMMAVTI